MTNTILLGAILAAIFVISMTIIPALAVGHLVLVDSTVYNTGKQLNAIIVVSVPVPTTSGKDFGYAFPFSDASGRLLAVVTHPTIGDDSSAQKSSTDPIFHTHVVTLKTVSAGICSSTTAIASATLNEVGTATISNNVNGFVIINDIPSGQVPGLTNAPALFL